MTYLYMLMHHMRQREETIPALLALRRPRPLRYHGLWRRHIALLHIAHSDAQP